MDIEKAKEICKEIIKTNMFNRHTDAYAIETVLNELEKKDKEIARLGKTANEYKKAIQYEKCNCSVCEAHINTLELRAELEKKDKVINEMAGYIDKTTEEIAREKGVEDFEFCDNKCTDKDEYIDCKDCIIEYFTKKVEGK